MRITVVSVKNNMTNNDAANERPASSSSTSVKRGIVPGPCVLGECRCAAVMLQLLAVALLVKLVQIVAVISLGPALAIAEGPSPDRAKSDSSKFPRLVLRNHIHAANITCGSRVTLVAAHQ